MFWLAGDDQRTLYNAKGISGSSLKMGFSVFVLVKEKKDYFLVKGRV